jgi:benzylsuccinate CoA-transferase BbsF subunit
LSHPTAPTAVQHDKNEEGVGDGAWAGTRILEFGSGAAGPIATRYFAEQGATVIKVESKTRPDFLRTYALSPKNPHGLEGGDMFDALNVGKLGITLNMKHPRGIDIAKRLAFEWCNAVTENFAPKAMRGFGMDYDTLAAVRPDLVMLSACLQGQTGPHRDYPGFGGQGAALSGFNILTGWPDRDPLGPYGTITDSLAPRFAAAALAAALLYRRRTGRGVYLDLSQVECAAWSLSPWLLDFEINDRVTIRNGNASDRAVVHGVFSCAGDDRWVAIAAWDTEEAERLAKIAGDDLEAWTRARSAGEVAEIMQAAGIEAVPVADFGDAYADEQLAHRRHFVPLSHPFMGDGAYEHNGFRLSDASSGYTRASPTLGQDNADVLGGILGLSDAEQQQLADEGVLD